MILRNEVGYSAMIILIGCDMADVTVYMQWEHNDVRTGFETDNWIIFSILFIYLNYDR